MTSKADVYRHLEDLFLTYQDLAAVPVEECGEPMMPIGPDFSGKVFVIDANMKVYTGDRIFVRATVLAMLESAQRALQTVLPGRVLEVVYGYRHLDIQTAKFEAQIRRVLGRRPELVGPALMEAAHRYTAVPEVAGHPTGGAIDLRILDQKGVPLPTGTNIHDFVDDTYVFSPFIGKEAWHNRQILRYCMQSAGFAPFDGEWWHFSYGDREWARYYNQPHAIYQQLRFTAADPAV